MNFYFDVFKSDILSDLILERKMIKVSTDLKFDSPRFKSETTIRDRDWNVSIVLIETGDTGDSLNGKREFRFAKVIYINNATTLPLKLIQILFELRKYYEEFTVETSLNRLINK